MSQGTTRLCIAASGCALGLMLLSWLPRLKAQPPKPVPSTVETSGRRLMTPRTQKAIDRGLAALAARQQDDGSFGSGRFYQRNVAVTGLAGMAFLSAGHLPGRGKYGKNVTRAIEYVLSRCRPNGYIVDADVRYHGPMYGHGFATLFLAEAYGTSSSKSLRKDIRTKLGKAVKLIVGSQNKEGGWRYTPARDDADVSVTVCQIMALRAARNAGIYVPKLTVKRCVDYIKRAQNPDGGFKYQMTRLRRSEFPRSAAAVVALYSAGVYKGREISKGLAFLMRYLPGRDVPRHEGHYYYSQYYAVQAMWHAGGTHWKSWYPAIRDELLREQSPSGAWVDEYINVEYGTAMALLVLQMPNNYLPIFQR